MVSTPELMAWTALVVALMLALAWLTDRLPEVKAVVGVVEDLLASVFLISGLTVVMISVVTRYVFNNPLGWADEFARVFVAWGAMFGFSVALRERRHIGVDLLYTAVSDRAKHALDLFANFIGLVFAAFMSITGWKYVAFLKMLGLKSIYTDIPEWILQLIIPLGFLFFALQFAINLFDVLRGREPIHEEVAGV
ncbi:MAG TPA: TRAP transporter small permease [Oceanithermus profundus]|uniref:TRAP transporter small permease n=1 Tax=Oceanithermus profundus TaxID=187137 RepID=A0A7C4ZHV8_9DEIN|nr:TRAP transporter small permease [Oceanithermus profundus]